MSSFAEQINYDAVFAGLASQHHLVFSEENKTAIRTVCTEELTGFDGNHFIPGNIGAFVIEILSGIANFFRNVATGHGDLSLDGISNRLSSAADQTADGNKALMLNQATMRIYTRLQQMGGDFAKAAPLITGQAAVNGVSHSPTPDMEDSIYRQILSNNNLPISTSANLNRNATGIS